MKKYDAVFLDRDGTLNPDPGYIDQMKDFQFFPFTIPALKLFSTHCNVFCIVSNQSGVGRGIIKSEVIEEINNYIQSLFKKHNLKLVDILNCFDHPDFPTHNRKPGTGMFETASKVHGIKLDRSLMVGDSESDIEAGNNLMMDTMLVLTGKGKETFKKLNNIKPTFLAEDLFEGAKIITS